METYGFQILLPDGQHEQFLAAMALPIGSLGYDPVATFLGKPVTADDPNTSVETSRVERSVGGLRELARSYAWASVLELSASLLAHDDDERTMSAKEVQECAAWRCIALLQTRQDDRAHDMLRAYEVEVSDEETPFLLRIAAADAAARVSPERIEALYEILPSCEGQPQRIALVHSALSVAHARVGQHDAAVDAARACVHAQGGTARALYMYARVLLGVGDVQGARMAIARAGTRADDSASLRLAHEALLLAAEARFEEAAMRFDAAAHLADHKDATAYERNITVFAANNAAICLLHLGRCDEALTKLESCLRSNPKMALDEGVVVNVATLYDLTAPDSAPAKKGVLKALASKYARQGFDLDVISSS